jgi:S-adenosylmethionine decarboxylase
VLPGTEWIVDAAGCSADALRDRRLLMSLCERIVVDMKVMVVGEPLWHQFPGPGGVTGLYLLSESHLACHTYPELGAATFNLYCCSERAAWGWGRELRAALGATSVQVTRVMRGSAEYREGEAVLARGAAP